MDLFLDFLIFFNYFLSFYISFGLIYFAKTFKLFIKKLNLSQLAIINYYYLIFKNSTYYKQKKLDYILFIHIKQIKYKLII